MRILLHLVLHRISSSNEFLIGEQFRRLVDTTKTLPKAIGQYIGFWWHSAVSHDVHSTKNKLAGSENHFSIFSEKHTDAHAYIDFERNEFEMAINVNALELSHL